MALKNISIKLIILFLFQEIISYSINKFLDSLYIVTTGQNNNKKQSKKFYIIFSSLIILIGVKPLNSLPSIEI